MKLSQDKIEGTKIASLVHDIGKVNLPTEIVSKPSKLVEVEFNLIKNHPRVGYNILKKVDFPWPIAKIVLQHQEKIDGSGYPRGLKGDEICIEAKILGVANVVEAMSSYKSYRPALSIDEALAEIIENKNILFDPKVVDTCIKLFKEKNFKF
jgi:HD-GYP domain-containing protein (c-di-GMP phosphodiesterase class II)